MLTPFDEYPIHQTSLPLAQPGSGHPDFYDRYWFNGFRDGLYFAVALGIYPNKGIIDAAFSVVRNGFQRSVFASGRLPLDHRQLRIGPISIEIVEPFRINRIVVDAPEFQLAAEIEFRARTAAFEEARQTHYQGTRLWMDSTRATQFGSWTGTLTVAGEYGLLGPGHRRCSASRTDHGVSAPSPATSAPRRRSRRPRCSSYGPLYISRTAYCTGWYSRTRMDCHGRRVRQPCR
ncbi:hypothetical protein ACW2Q0_20530 [Nocardia sp. R16R-3T]